MVSIVLARSKTSPFRKNKPFSAQRPLLTTTTSGTARPNAQGQATTKTVTKCVNDTEKEHPKR